MKTNELQIIQATAQEDAIYLDVATTDNLTELFDNKRFIGGKPLRVRTSTKMRGQKLLPSPLTIPFIRINMVNIQAPPPSKPHTPQAFINKAIDDLENGFFSTAIHTLYLGLAKAIKENFGKSSLVDSKSSYHMHLFDHGVMAVVIRFLAHAKAEDGNHFLHTWNSINMLRNRSYDENPSFDEVLESIKEGRHLINHLYWIRNHHQLRRRELQRYIDQFARNYKYRIDSNNVFVIYK